MVDFTAKTNHKTPSYRGSIVQVRSASPMPTRPCKYCFSLQEASVFADFEMDEANQLYLVRISFDGYGCCHPAWKTEPIMMSLSESTKLSHYVEADDLAHPEVAQILRSYFTRCGEAIWIDALRDHELL